MLSSEHLVPLELPQDLEPVSVAPLALEDPREDLWAVQQEEKEKLVDLHLVLLAEAHLLA
jgi:hypothetical protein